MSPGDDCSLVFWIHWILKLQPVKYDPKLQMFEHFLVFDHLRQSRQLPPTASHALSPPPVSCSNRPTSTTSDCRTLEYFWYSLKLGQANMCWCCHITYPVTIFATRFPSHPNTFRTSHDVTAAFPIVQCWLWRPPAFHCSYIQPGGATTSTESTFLLFHCSYIQPGGGQLRSTASTFLLFHCSNILLGRWEGGGQLQAACVLPHFFGPVAVTYFDMFMQHKFQVNCPLSTQVFWNGPNSIIALSAFANNRRENFPPQDPE